MDLLLSLLLDITVANKAKAETRLRNALFSGLNILKIKTENQIRDDDYPILQIKYTRSAYNEFGYYEQLSIRRANFFLENKYLRLLSMLKMFSYDMHRL